MVQVSFYPLVYNVMPMILCIYLLCSVILCGLWFHFLNLGLRIIGDLDMLNVLSFSMEFFFLGDSASMLVGWVVFLISFCVTIFSAFYMRGEVFMVRFLLLVMIFVFSMEVLVFFPSFMGLMMGWDWLGLTSFLLVVYYQDKWSLGAGMLTAMTNRLGDGFFIVVVALMMGLMGWGFDYGEVAGVGGWVAGLLVLGGMTKSAQVPFSAWLPAAMAAPTPVSALVHSSTLVTAGVYVMYRYSGVLSESFMYFLGVCAVMTMVMASMSACFEVNSKKVVALSTLSQLGVMMMSISVGLSDLAIYHLVSHAFCKAMLFMAVGSSIYMSCGSQDFRLMGGMWFRQPVECSWSLVAQLCLVGLPFLSVFYSKHAIMECSLGEEWGLFVMVMVLFSVFFTSWYSIRMWFLLSFGDGVKASGLYSNISMSLFVPLLVLGFVSVFSGKFFSESLWGVFSFSILSSCIDVLFKLMMVLGVLLYFVNYYVSLWSWSVWGGESKVRSLVYYFCGKMWFLQVLSGTFLSVKVLSFMLLSMKGVEKVFLSGLVFGKGMMDIFIMSRSNLNAFINQEFGVLLLVSSAMFLCLLVWCL